MDGLVEAKTGVVGRSLNYSINPSSLDSLISLNCYLNATESFFDFNIFLHLFKTNSVELSFYLTI